MSILEILTGQECKKMRIDENSNPKAATRYELNSLGHITKIMYSSTESRIGVFPIEICGLEFLEELAFINQNIRLIPETIGRLKRLKVLNLRLNKIEYLPESIKKLKNLELFYLKSDIKETK